MRECFLRMERLGFGRWTPDDVELAAKLCALERLGFRLTLTEQHPPTGLDHRWYELTAAEFAAGRSRSAASLGG